MRSSTKRRAGVTLIEMMVANVVFVAMVGMLFLTVRSGQETVDSGERMSDNTEWAKRAASRIEEDLLESGVAYVDTAFRYHDASNPGNDQMTNHCWEHVPRLRQCASASCPGNRRIEQGALADKAPEIYAGRNYALYGNATEAVYASGRVFQGLESTLCPLHASVAPQGANLDAIMIFSPRDEAGVFVTGEWSTEQKLAGKKSTADWQSIVFYFPYYDGQVDDLQLRRQVVYRRDLLTGDVPGTTYASFSAGASGWIDWDLNNPPGVPAMIDLFDFGTDGTLDADPDGQIPLTTALSDADVDSLQAYSYPGAQPGLIESYMYRYKALTSVPNVWLSNYLYVDRRTGQVYWYVYFSRGSAYWYRYVEFTRPCEVVARGLVDCDFSTKVSNPRTAQNPNGVDNDAVVRATLLFSREARDEGEARRVDHALSFEVKPRNY